MKGMAITLQPRTLECPQHVILEKHFEGNCFFFFSFDFTSQSSCTASFRESDTYSTERNHGICFLDNLNTF